WAHRAEDSARREKQLLIDFLCQSAGGPLFYTGRNMHTSHKGLRIDEADWAAFLVHLNATLEVFHVPAAERSEILAFVQSTKADFRCIRSTGVACNYQSVCECDARLENNSCTGYALIAISYTWPARSAEIALHAVAMTTSEAASCCKIVVQFEPGRGAGRPEFVKINSGAR